MLSTIPDDTGGMTFWGISRKWNPTWLGWAIIDQNPNDTSLPGLVYDFYKQNFWDKNFIGQLNSQQLAMQLFDAIVNMGEPAIVAIQVLVGTSMDGIMGIKTIDSCNANDGDRLANAYIGWRKLKYTNIARAGPSQKKFLNGWLNRCVLA